VAATGGCYRGHPACGHYDQDLLADTTDPATGFDFEPLIRACRNLLRQGVKPDIVTGNVPVLMSEAPRISQPFTVNIRPPRQEAEHRGYIKALAQALVRTFGIEEVCSWKWSAGTEFNNEDWFAAADGSAATTQAA